MVKIKYVTDRRGYRPTEGEDIQFEGTGVYRWDPEQQSWIFLPPTSERVGRSVKLGFFNREMVRRVGVVGVTIPADCNVVGINGDCGEKCPVYLRGECPEPSEMDADVTPDKTEASH